MMVSQSKVLLSDGKSYYFVRWLDEDTIEICDETGSIFLTHYTSITSVDGKIIQPIA